MVQFLNLFLKKIISPDIKVALNIYESFRKDLPDWSCLEVNSISDGIPSLFKSADLKTKDNTFNIRIQLIADKKNHEIWQNKKNRFTLETANSEQLDLSYNYLIDQIFSNEIKNFQKTLNQSIEKFSNSSFNDNVDDKTLEWLKVSFVVLEKAIIESLTNNELIFSIKLYIGRNPMNNLPEIRIIIFNLDICYRLNDKGLLEITIYDDKNQKQNSSKIPVLHTTTFNKSRECLDQLVNILSLCSKGIKIT